MKRIFRVGLSILLVVASCCSFVACTQQGVNSTGESTAPQTKPQTMATQGINASYPALVISTLEEYRAHFEKTGGYPAGFVSYDDLSLLGAYCSFVSQSYIGVNPDYSYCRYRLLEESGLEIFVTIEPKGLVRNLYSWVADSVEDTMIGTDMRRNDTAKSMGKVMCGNVLYSYSMGELSSIVWVEGENEITLSLRTKLSQYPYRLKDTLIGRLLDLETAPGAIQELGIAAEEYRYNEVDISDEATQERLKGYETLELYSLEAYNAHFAAEGGFPEGFVTYDEISGLGTFEALMVQSYFGTAPFYTPYSLYTYVIRDATGMRLTVNVTPFEYYKYTNMEQADLVNDTIVGNDMRTNLTDKETGIVDENRGCQYFYRMGQLEAVLWYNSGECRVTLCGPLYAYPSEKTDTLLGKLLNRETAREVIAQLPSYLNSKG